MAENKKSIIVYAEWIETFEAIEDAQAGKLIKHFFKYVNDLNPEAPDKMTELLFIPIRQALKRDLKKYETYIDKQKSNGLKGGRPKAKETQITQPFISEPKKADNDNDIVNVNDNKKSIIDRKREFYNSLIPFLMTYDKNLIKEFYDYWSESGERDKKFRKEKQKSFDVNLRLKTWLKNQNKFALKDQKEKKQTGAESFKNLVYGSITNL